MSTNNDVKKFYVLYYIIVENVFILVAFCVVVSVRLQALPLLCKSIVLYIGL